jgi:hypothetical protein
LWSFVKKVYLLSIKITGKVWSAVMKLRRVLFLIARDIKALMLKSLTAKIVLAFLLLGVTHAYAQTDTQPAADTSTESATAQVDHSSGPTQGQSTYRANIEEMLNLYGVEQQVAEYFYDIRKVYESKFQNVKATPDVVELVVDHRNKLFRMLNGLLSWEAQKEVYIDAYQSLLSEQDVADVVAFLKSDAGQNALAGQAAMQRLVEQHNHEQMQVMSPQIESITNELKAQIKQLVDANKEQ